MKVLNIVITSVLCSLFPIYSKDLVLYSVTQVRQKEDPEIFQGISFPLQGRIESKVSIKNGKVRIDFETAEGSLGMTALLGYLVIDYSSGELYIVNPTNRTVIEFEFNEHSDNFNVSSVKGDLHADVVESRMEKIEERDGEKIAGYPTKYVKLKGVSTVEMQYKGKKVKGKTERVINVWYTDKIKFDRTDIFLSNLGVHNFRFKVEKDRYRIKGLPLKIVVEEKGSLSGKRVTEYYVTLIEEKDLSDDIFLIPSDYKRVDISKFISVDAIQGNLLPGISE